MQSLIGFQLEGIGHGVVPQHPPSLPYPIFRRWSREVWQTYLKTQPGYRKSKTAAKMYRKGRQKHTHQAVGASGTYSLRTKR